MLPNVKMSPRKLCPRPPHPIVRRLSKVEDGPVHKFKSSKPPHSSQWLNITVKTTPAGPQMHNLFFLVSLFTQASPRGLNNPVSCRLL